MGPEAGPRRSPDEPADRDRSPDITVYWRLGCPFCVMLSNQLEQAGVRAEWIDIWQSREAAAFVRSVNDGDETVPTVVVAGQPLTNPSLEEVLSASGQEPPTVERGSA